MLVRGVSVCMLGRGASEYVLGRRVCVCVCVCVFTLAHGLEFGGGTVGQGLPQVQHLYHSQNTTLLGWRVFP